MCCAALIAAPPAARAADRRPVVLLFHAGGLLIGHADLMDPLRPIVRGAGMKPVPVEYALFDYPRAFEDAEAAARRYRGRRIYAYGESAGATLAGWLAARHLVSAAAGNSPIVNLTAYVRAVKRSNPDNADLVEQASGGPRFVRRHSLQRIRGSPLRLYGNCRDPVAPCDVAIRYARHYSQVSWRRAGVGHIGARNGTLDRALAWFGSVAPPAPSRRSARSRLETRTG